MSPGLGEGDTAIDEKWQRARLFPVTGIGSPNEQERRGCSVFFAVLSSVKEFGRAMTGRCGAPAGVIETCIEVPFELNGSHCRPDGLIRVTRGQRSWVALVEVKTGRNDLEADQVSTYLDVAREHDYDAVITISHQVATTPGVHPVAVDRRKTRKVDLKHISWSRIHTEAKIQHANHDVSDPDQAWLLSEFIRYIEDSKSGALDFEYMGPSWATVRDGARQQTLRANDPETLAVVTRFDQLIAFSAMELSRRLGVHVSQRLSKSELDDQATRLQKQAAVLSKDGQLSGDLLVPNAAVPFEITVDLRANRIDAKATILAPADRRAQARVTWMLNQLKGAPQTLQVVANVSRAKGGRRIALSALLENPKAAVDQPNADIRSFTLTLSQPASRHEAWPRQGIVRLIGHWSRRAGLWRGCSTTEGLGTASAQAKGSLGRGEAGSRRVVDGSVADSGLNCPSARGPWAGAGDRGGRAAGAGKRLISRDLRALSCAGAWRY
jgi:hypothetical protein